MDETRSGVVWTYSKRCKSPTCEAAARQRDDSYIRGDIIVCQAQPGHENVAEVRQEVMAKCGSRPFDSASELVDGALLEKLTSYHNGLHPTLPCPDYITARANYQRPKTRPRHPDDLGFDPDHDDVGT